MVRVGMVGRVGVAGEAFICRHGHFIAEAEAGAGPPAHRGSFRTAKVQNSFRTATATATGERAANFITLVDFCYF